jgi:hypothetical protein
MGVAAREVSTAGTWGPVRRGFRVVFPNGDSGRVEEIRVSEGGVELVVEAGGSGRFVAVDGADVEAILPRRQRIVVGSLTGRDGAAGVAAAGGIIRMPARHWSRIAGDPEQSA